MVGLTFHVAALFPGVTMPERPLILASSSVYRRSLLERLSLPFTVVKPDADETPHRGESPLATALRLAASKAQAVAAAHPRALIIGSDQVADLDGEALGKPGTHESAVRQLRAMSGRCVVFHTALCLLDAASGRSQLENVPTAVQFRQLGNAQIESYLRRERPYDCAGSAKIESLGIALVQKIDSDDPTAVIGLPLMMLVTLLQRENVAVI
jgi:septum formation protein